MTDTRRRPANKTARRESREARQERARRQELRRTLALLVAASIAVIVGAYLLGLHNRQPAAIPPRSIDGILCGAEQGDYHEHTHLTILNAGRALAIPTTIGHGPSDCLYWLHTHDSDPAGLIHIEAPHRIVPRLGTFFDIWGRPLSRHAVAGIAVQAGQTMKVYVAQTLYPGDPRRINLRPHTAITIEVGPPFRPPQHYTFGEGY